MFNSHLFGGTSSTSSAPTRDAADFTREHINTPNVGKGESALAVDVGGTFIKAGLISPEGDFVDITRIPTPNTGRDRSEDVMNAIKTLYEGYTFAAEPPTRVSVILPGTVDDEHGIGLHSENLGWDNVPFADLLTEKLGVPTRVTHDVRGSGIAEYKLGYASEFRNFMVLTIGTGIAGAIFLNGELVVSDGYAGEVGHIPVYGFDGMMCKCGQRGCTETAASAASIISEYNRISPSTVTDASQVVARMKEGDAAATRVWDNATTGLARAISLVETIVAPEAVLLAGGLAQAGEDLLNPIHEKLEKLLTFQRMPQLLVSKLVGVAGLSGAALLSRILEF